LARIILEAAACSTTPQVAWLLGGDKPHLQFWPNATIDTSMNAQIRIGFTDLDLLAWCCEKNRRHIHHQAHQTFSGESKRGGNPHALRHYSNSQ
jgi:hypothetical protein